MKRTDNVKTYSEIISNLIDLNETTQRIGKELESEHGGSWELENSDTGYYNPMYRGYECSFVFRQYIEEEKELPKSLRDEFAMAALQGLLANPQGKAGHWKEAAKGAYKAADAMMKERQ